MNDEQLTMNSMDQEIDQKIQMRELSKVRQTFIDTMQ